MTQPKRRGLGRGLDALLKSTAVPVSEAEAAHGSGEPASAEQPASDGSDTAGGGVRWVDIDAIRPNPYQPRQHFAPEALEELAASIRQHGLIQPLLVQEGPEGHTLIAGERRWQASRLAGLDKVPVVLRVATRQEMLALAIIENVQRENLDPVEAAASYQRLVQEFGLSQAEVADLVGKSRVSITNTLRLLSLPEALRSLISAGHLSEGHARALLGLRNSEEQLSMARRAIDEGWTVRRLEAAVRERQALLEGAVPARSGRNSAADSDPNTMAAIEQLESALGTRVEIRRRGQAGQVVLHFYSEEELNNLYRRLGGGAG